jgi:PAS domain S-box-containing protein
MSWYLPSLIASLFGSAILALVFTFLYYQYRERHMGFWALGWGAHALRYGFDLALPGPEAMHLIQASVLASGLLLLRGVEEMAQDQMSRVFKFGGLLCAGWILLGAFTDLPFLEQNFPVFMFFAAVAIRTGQKFLLMENLGGPGRILTGWGFIHWGLHRANYPFLASVEEFAPLRFMLATLLSLTVAIGMLLVYFQRVLASLSVSEKRFRTLVEQATDGMFLLNLDGRILDANRHACRSLGYSKEELLQLSLHDIVEDLTDIILPRRPDRLAPGVPSTLEGRHRRRDGTGFPVDIRISVIDPPNADRQLLALARDISKQKETEDLLRQSSQKFEALYHQSFQLIGLLSPDGTVLDANQTALRLIDGQLSEIQGRPFWETPWWVHDPRLQERLRRAIERAARGEVARLEAHLPTGDGGRLMVDLSLKPVMDETGRVSMLIAEGRDITERIHFEHSLKAINMKLEALIDASPMPIIAINLEEITTEWNRAAEQTFGWPREEIIGRPYPLTPKPELGEGATTLQQTFTGKKISWAEVHRQTKSGALIELDLYSAPLYDGDGNISGGMGIFVDRGKQKRAEIALRESEAQYKKLYHQFEILLNGIPDPITLVDRDMKIVWANQGAAKAFNQEHTQISDQHCYRFWHGKNAVCPECPVIDCFDSGEVQERKITTPDGRVWGAKVFPIRDNDGRVANALELVTEITEKIRLRKQAERSNRLTALGELSAGIAHEINNPNGLILLNLPVLTEAFNDIEPVLAGYAEAHPDFSFGGLPFSRMRHEIPEILHEMRDGALRIKRIVDDLKNFVRQDPLPNTCEVELNQALETAVRLTTPEIKRATDHFSVSYGDDLAAVNGDSQRIEQVLVNLIINACQALPDKSRGLAVASRYDAASGMNVIEVRDQGKGIEAGHLNHLTDPFFTTRRESGGTGLGLSVSARIVKDHHGELRFDSVPGRGTSVSLLLPPLKEVNK